MRMVSIFLAATVVVCSSATFIPGKNPTKASDKKIKSLKLRSKANAYYIIIDKSDYELKVYDDEGWYATYPVVFGNKDLSDKMQQGDRKTPEGTFKIIVKKIHPSWGPELLLDYPTKASVKLFNERKSKGFLSKNAKIGGGIAIHSTGKDSEWTVDNYYNWTEGCISVKHAEMLDLYSYIDIGTQVTIHQ